MRKQTTFVIALAIAAAVASQAHAGMSGTSDRVQQMTNSEARATAPTQPHPQLQAPPQRQAPAAPSGGNFDGRWAVSSSPGCGLSARSAVQVKQGRISGPSLNGSIDAAGNVRTVARGGGLSVVSTGRASGAVASGSYRVSNGCTGTWTASKA